MEAEGSENVRSVLFAELLEMGFPEERIAQALASTSDREQAVALLLAEAPVPAAEQEEFEDEEEEVYKMVFVVRSDLKLPLSKVAECAATAALAAYRQMAAFVDVDDLKEYAFFEWSEGGQRKIVVKAPSEKELRQLVELAQKKGINYALVHEYPSNFGPIAAEPKKSNKKTAMEEEKTEEKPKLQAQKEVLILGAFGPASESEIDPLTKHFKLL